METVPSPGALPSPATAAGPHARVQPGPPQTSPCCHRRAQKSKELARNKKERSLQRDAHAKTADPEALRQELQEVLAAEQAASNPALRLKKKTLQHAYEQALKKQMVRGGRSGWPIDPPPAAPAAKLDAGRARWHRERHPHPSLTGGHRGGQGGRVGTGARAGRFGVLPPHPQPPRPAATRQDTAVREARCRVARSWSVL